METSRNESHQTVQEEVKKNTNETNLPLSHEITSTPSATTPLRNSLKSAADMKKTYPARRSALKTNKTKELGTAGQQREIPQPTVDTNKVEDAQLVSLIYDKHVVSKPLFDFSGLTVDEPLEPKHISLNAFGLASKRLLTFGSEPGKQNAGVPSIKAILLQNAIISELDLVHQAAPTNASNRALNSTRETEKQKKDRTVHQLGRGGEPKDSLSTFKRLEADLAPQLLFQNGAGCGLSTESVSSRIVFYGPNSGEQLLPHRGIDRALPVTGSVSVSSSGKSKKRPPLATASVITPSKEVLETESNLKKDQLKDAENNPLSPSKKCAENLPSTKKRKK